MEHKRSESENKTVKRNLRSNQLSIKQRKSSDFTLLFFAIFPSRMNEHSERARMKSVSKAQRQTMYHSMDHDHEVRIVGMRVQLRKDPKDIIHILVAMKK